MHRRRAAGVSAMIRRSVDAGRWIPSDTANAVLTGLERTLSIRIQAGQPALDAMQTAMISELGDTLLEQARSATMRGDFASTVHERRMLKVATLSVVAAIGHDPEARTLAA